MTEDVEDAALRFKEVHQRCIHEFGAALAIFGTVLWIAHNNPHTLLLRVSAIG